MHNQVASLAETAVTDLPGVGPRMAEKLARLNIFSLADLYFHLPLRYEDRSRIWPIGRLRAGQWAQIDGEVVASEVRLGPRPSLLVQLSDGSGDIWLRYFHTAPRQRARFVAGRRLRCFGQVRYRRDGLELTHPETEHVGGQAAPLPTYLTPVYPLVEGVGQKTLRRLVAEALQRLNSAATTCLEELLPAEVRAMLAVPTLYEAIIFLHQPPLDSSLQLINEGAHPAQQRLIYEELLAHHLNLRQLRQSSAHHRAPCLAAKGVVAGELLQRLPFSLTAAQQRVWDDIRRDLAADTPMQRLLQGDVGSGKTVVAALAMVDAVEAGFQAVLMAPTELLAEQHFNSLKAWLDPLGLRLGHCRGVADRGKQILLAQLSQGDIDIVVGTHAVFQDQVSFAQLGLVVIDEQHRFGVQQRLTLREKGLVAGRYPHQLIMTATPIPRTLAMTVYADLDLSVIDQLPPGRQPTTTVVLADTRRDEVIERIRTACAEGRQAYWVCTVIEESEQLQCQAAAETAERLAHTMPALRIGLVHGRLKAADKESVMDRFRRGDVDLLVATTVIEVGVDVPQASLMIIENAERLGLAQLHQLRGRVGRGSTKSVCLLMYHGPLSSSGRERLLAMRETNDGFEIARRDLALRGPGEVLGTRQSGALQLRIADLVRDQALIPKVEQSARLLLERYPRQVSRLVQRWLGDRGRFGSV